jgi:riboflavin kinase/FMN adenylyltransferase
MLTDVEQRIEQFRSLGIRLAGILHFPDIRDLSPKDFSEQVLSSCLQAERVVVGADFRFGRGREGDATFLRSEGERLGFEVDVVDMFGAFDGVVSSTRIRKLLIEGDVETAAQMLARPYPLNGQVVEGERRGRELGFPTANLQPASQRLVPGNGVYAGRAIVGDEQQQAVVNIGLRPTFSGSQRRIEAHLLDFDSDIYGAELAIDFIARIRDERRFGGIEELKHQIGLDVLLARDILGRTG